VAGAQLTDTAPWGGGGTLGDALLAPTVLYVRPVLKLIQQLPVKVRTSSGLRSSLQVVHACRHAVELAEAALSLVADTGWARQQNARDASMCIVQGLVHMTGGGFPENIPRVVPKGLQTRIDRSAWEVPELFRWLQKVGLVVRLSILKFKVEMLTMLALHFCGCLLALQLQG
jgi:phosphoribosylaminoimidazole (AIR) synthetase